MNEEALLNRDWPFLSQSIVRRIAVMLGIILLLAVLFTRQSSFDGWHLAFAAPAVNAHLPIALITFLPFMLFAVAFALHSRRERTAALLVAIPFVLLTVISACKQYQESGELWRIALIEDLRVIPLPGGGNVAAYWKQGRFTFMLVEQRYSISPLLPGIVRSRRLLLREEGDDGVRPYTFQKIDAQHFILRLDGDSQQSLITLDTSSAAGQWPCVVRTGRTPLAVFRFIPIQVNPYKRCGCVYSTSTR